MASLAAAREFLYREGRLLEARLFETLFDGAPADGVVAAVAAYANADGGLGHALEPDVRCPESQPLFVGHGLEALAAVGAAPYELLSACCDFLARTTNEQGAVPTLLPSAFAHPLAPHWGDWALEPALTMTASIAGSLHLLRFEHPWRDAATAYSLRELDREPPDDAHVLRFALRLLDAIGDDRRLEGVAAAIPAARWYRSDPRSAEYGVTPLQLSPSPAFARATFGDELVDAHLGALAAEQQPDGGWPVTWQPPGDGARREWRGNRTVDALRLLREYGRL